MTPISVAKKLSKMWLLWRQVPEDSKYLWSWFISILPGHFPLVDERPWITFKAISWLEKYLKPEMKVFEYGSGGSTIFLSCRVKEVYSVEHDEKYFSLVEQVLKNKGLKNCKYLLEIPMERQGLPVEYDLQSCTSFMERWSGLCFSNYVSTIDSYPDGFFDLVLVDGRSRISCLRRGLRKVKQGGWILLDNSERQGYELGRELLSKYKRYDFFGLVPSNMELYQTSVWQLDNAPDSR